MPSKSFEPNTNVCPSMIIGVFNIDMLDQNLTQPNELNFFIDHYSMKFQLKKLEQFMVPHVDHIWINTHIQQCMSKVVKTYWTNHKPMYLAFKLSNCVSQYH